MKDIKETQTPQIRFTKESRTYKIQTIDATSYKDMCETDIFNCHEITPDDRLIKPYFDIEIKPHHCKPSQAYDDRWIDILNIATIELLKHFPNAKFASLNASSESYICCIKSKETWIISLHIIVSNYIASKSQMLSIVNLMNASLRDNLNDNIGQYFEIEDVASFKLFDDSVYDPSRKMRSAFANKTHFDGSTVIVENRPMEIVQGTFEETVISSFFVENPLQLEMQTVTPTIASTVVQPATDEMKTENELFVKMAIENGFLRNHTDRKEWIQMGCALHHSVGGNNGIALFDYYSQQYPKYYDRSGVIKTWESLKDINGAQKKPTTIATIHKWCKDEDIEKYKQIVSQVKTITKANMIQDQLKQLEATIDPALTYVEMKIEFEKSHFKIIDKALFFTIEPNGEITIHTKQSLQIAYEHMRFDKVVKNQIVPSAFVDEWLKDPSMRKYDRADVYPPDQVVPPNVFNLWVPFAMELVDTWEDKPDELDLIRKHILILCNNEQHIADYFELWIAQMIQQPSIKTICPTMISEQGAGKGTIMQLFIKMFGTSKVLNEMTNPSRDVWGNFNSLMKQAFLVNVDELSGKDSRDAVGQIKALIKSATISINSKGQAPIIVKSYHRFFNTTNNSDPVSVSKDDRRNCVIRSSDELCRNASYFNKMYEILSDVNVIKTCYEYFKNLKGATSFNAIPIPHTEYHEEMSQLSISPIEAWLKDYTQEFYNVSGNEIENTYELPSSNCFTLFNEWKEKTHMTYDVNALKFSVQMSRLKINGINSKKGSKGIRLTVLNLIKLAEHFKI